MKLLRIPGVGAFAFDPDKGEALIAANALFATRLRAQLLGPDGQPIGEERDLGSGVVTTAGVVYLAADMAGGASDISAFAWHGTGIGAAAAVIGDTALGNTTGAPARVAAANSAPGATNIFRSIATTPYVSSLAITEWGLFSAVTVGTMWDRRVFAAINVISGDSIQWTYDLTVNAGG